MLAALRAPKPSQVCLPVTRPPAAAMFPGQSPTSAMAGNLSTSMQWGGAAETWQRRFMDDEEEEEAESSGRRRSTGSSKSKKKAKPRQSSGENYNARASCFCMLTPWNKIQILAELSPDSFGAVYGSTFSLDELDCALYVGTGRTPNDKLLYRNKQLNLQACCSPSKDENVANKLS